MARPPLSPLSPRSPMGTDNGFGWSSPSKEDYDSNECTSTSPNTRRSPMHLTTKKPDGAVQSRPRRKLPELGTPAPSSNKLRRTKSMSYLPDSSSNENGSRNRRRLPDPGQGRLIKLVEEKLKEESVQRLELAKELKQEKRTRWELEDKLANTQQQLAELNERFQQRKKDMAQMLKDLEEEGQAKLALERELDQCQKRLAVVQHDLAKEQSRRDARRAADHDAEATIEEAWAVAFEEKRLRQRAEEDLLIMRTQFEKFLVERGLLEHLQAQHEDDEV